MAEAAHAQITAALQTEAVELGRSHAEAMAAIQTSPRPELCTSTGHKSTVTEYYYGH